MSAVQSWRGKSTAPADCLTCGESSPTDDPDQARSWARRHVERNNGHRVHVEVHHVRVYISGGQP